MRTQALILGALLASTALASPALAQTAAPRFVEVDGHGVDLTSGLPSFAMTEGSIGSGEGAVAMERYWAQGAGWTDNWSGGLYQTTINGATKTVVLLGSISDIFTQSGSTYTSDNASGTTLVQNSPGSYTYTARDGTRIEFSQQTETGLIRNCPGGSGICNLPSSLTRPNGLTYAIAWSTDSICVWFQGECVVERFYKRLWSVTSSAGYKLTVAYASNNIGEGPQPNPAWLERTTVTFTNTASAPSPLPTVTYSYPSTGVTDVTDIGGRTWRLTTSSNRLTGIRRPGSASNNISYVYTNGLVSSATKDGVTATYSRSDVGTTRTTTITNALSQQTVAISDLTKGRVTSVKDPLNRITAYQYDANSRLTRTTMPEGNYVQLTLDARGNATESRAVAKSGSGLADIVATAAFPGELHQPEDLQQSDQHDRPPRQCDRLHL